MTIFVVQARDETAAALERASFIADGFSWPAFVFGWAWLLYQRLWLAFIVWMVLEAAYLVLVFPHVPIATSLIVDALARAFVAFEGHGLRQSKLARRAVLTDIVEARDRGEAEAIFFRRHVPAEPTP